MAIVGEPVVDLGDRWLTVIASSFRSGDPLSPKQACCLRVSVALVPKDAWTQWGEYVLGGEEYGDIWPLSELPEWVRLMVTPTWLRHFLRVFVDIGHRIDDGGIPYPHTMAERVALWIALRQARKIGPALNGSMVYDALNALLDQKPPAEADKNWNRAQVRLFDGDFDFLRIWRAEFDRIGFGAGSEACFAAPELRRFHPCYWWDVDSGCDRM
jgi:hypothetical protein